jgi:E3 ubiquitin-protein ligase DOA10
MLASHKCFSRKNGPTLLQVTFLLFVEVGVFPSVCGLWLDLCTLQLSDATIRDRQVLWQEAIFTCSFLYWLVGMFYILSISLFLTMLREVLRSGAASALFIVSPSLFPRPHNVFICTCITFVGLLAFDRFLATIRQP